MKAQEEAFYSQFEGKNVDSFTVVKAAPSADNEIEAISGATITSKAMANGVNACITYFQNVLKEVLIMNKNVERLYNGFIKENPTFVLMLGMCPTLGGHIIRNQRTWHGTFYNSGIGISNYADFRIP